MHIQDRVDRLAKLFSHLPLSQDFPLLKAVKLPTHQVNQLKYMVGTYLWESLSAHQENFADCRLFNDQLFNQYTHEILKLPNITPNGLILPKRGNFLSFNLVQKVVVNIFKAMQLDTWVDSVHVPVNIRLVSKKSDEYGRRPRATTKVHIDTWAAEPTHVISAFIPLMGDFLKTGIEFFEAMDFPKELVKPLNDFLEGAHLLESARQYPVELSADYIYFTDSFLLHRTVLGGGPRLSLDFRFLLKEKLPSDIYTDSPRLQNYIPLKDWYEVSRQKLSVANDYVQAAGKDQINDGYATKMELVTV